MPIAGFRTAGTRPYRRAQVDAMQDKPKIDTAIPQRRYQLGAYTVVVLGEIESSDGKDYRYVAAVVREGDPEPGLAAGALNDHAVIVACAGIA